MNHLNPSLLRVHSPTFPHWVTRSGETDTAMLCYLEISIDGAGPCLHARSLRSCLVRSYGNLETASIRPRVDHHSGAAANSVGSQDSAATSERPIASWDRIGVHSNLLFCIVLFLYTRGSSHLESLWAYNHGTAAMVLWRGVLRGVLLRVLKPCRD